MRKSDGPPEGWWSFQGVLTPRQEVASYGVRGQMAKGVCRQKGCSRRVELEPRELCGKGLGLLLMKQVQELYRCSRVDGCGLQFHDEPFRPPLRLDQLVGRPNVRVRLRCDAGKCRFFRIWRVEEMIASLKERGKGGGSTDVEGLGKMMTTPCPLCKKVNWRADILWQNTDNEGWRRGGEIVFEAMGAG